MPNINIETQITHIEEFRDIQPLYKKFALDLKEILKRAAKFYAPHSIIETREKSLSSFSEKIIRKDKYIKPLEEMTDLCGGRVICHFSEQIKQLSKFLRENFEIDELNSLDVKSRLKAGEFGYRSVHYIVSPKKEEILGVHINPDFTELKAEIQLRTFNQHIWASVVHDRIYKSNINIPDDWKRDAARIAAILEDADNAFEKMSDTIDQLNIHFLPTPEPEEFQHEKEILKTLIKLNKTFEESVENYLKLAQLYNQEGKRKEVIKLLEPKRKNIEELLDPKLAALLKTELGMALCFKNKTNTNSQEYNKGIETIEQAIKLLEPISESANLELAKAWFFKAKTLRLNPETNFRLVRDAFETAHKLSGSNPFYYIEFLIADVKSNPDCTIDFDLFSTRLFKCISDWEDNVHLGVEVTKALFGTIKAATILNKQHLALNTYLKLIDIVLHDRVIFSKDLIEDEIKTISELAHFIEKEEKSIVTLGILLKWLKYSDKNAEVSLRKLVNQDCKIEEEALIIAGDGKFDWLQEQKYEPFIREACSEFQGTVISGGTNSGIPGLVGEVANKLKEEHKKQFCLTGFLPGNLPDEQQKSEHYDSFVSSAKDNFSFFDVLLYWINILFSKRAKEKILLLGFGGGTLALLEYKMALTLDVKTALLKDSGRAVSKLTSDDYWSSNENLTVVPEDELTFWALANRNKSGCFNEEELEKLAKQVHSFYREVSLKWYNPESENINQYKTIMDWELLDPKLKDSNLKQAKFIEILLRRVNLAIRKTEDPVLFKLNEEFAHFEFLAQLEHARWNAERLLSGWRLGEKKDISNKISPYIKRWQLLDQDTKDFDYNAVSKFPEMLKTIGYEIVPVQKTY